MSTAVLLGMDQPSTDNVSYSLALSAATFGGAANAKLLAYLLFFSRVRSFMRPENMMAIAAVPLYICCWTAGWAKVVTCGSMNGFSAIIWSRACLACGLSKFAVLVSKLVRLVPRLPRMQSYDVTMSPVASHGRAIGYLIPAFSWIVLAAVFISSNVFGGCSPTWSKTSLR